MTLLNHGRERRGKETMQTILNIFGPPVGVTVFCLGMSTAGVAATLTTATSIVGFLTACVGLLGAVFGCLWAYARWQKQKRENDHDE